MQVEHNVEKGLATFVKDQIGNVFSFSGCAVSVTALQLCQDDEKAAQAARMTMAEFQCILVYEHWSMNFL